MIGTISEGEGLIIAGLSIIMRHTVPADDPQLIQWAEMIKKLHKAVEEASK